MKHDQHRSTHRGTVLEPVWFGLVRVGRRGLKHRATYGSGNPFSAFRLPSSNFSF